MIALLALAVMAAVAPPVMKIEPRPLKSAGGLLPGQGAFRISIRSQVQLTAPLLVWLVRTEPATGEVAGLGRGQGVPLAGSNMIDSKPMIYAMPQGRYRLMAHVAGCLGVPPPNSVCTINGKAMPTRHCGEGSIEFSVVAGQLTDAGEFILELPREIDLGGLAGYREGAQAMRTAAIRWRKTAAATPAAFSVMTAGPPPAVASSFASNVSCETKPAGTKGQMLFYPFACPEHAPAN